MIEPWILASLNRERSTEVPYRGGEKVNLHAVEWVVEDEVFLTKVKTTYRTDDGRKVYVESLCNRRDKDPTGRAEIEVREALAEQLSHVSLTFPE